MSPILERVLRPFRSPSQEDLDNAEMIPFYQRVLKEHPHTSMMGVPPPITFQVEQTQVTVGRLRDDPPDEEPESSDTPVLAPPQSTITSITPNSGPASGGTAVTIIGTNFLPGASVKIGGVSCTSVVFVDATKITCTTGAHASGVVNVVVQNDPSDSDFDATLSNGFTYLGDPTISRITGHFGFPASDPVRGNDPDYAFPWGDAAGGDTIHIYGSNFVSGATVTFGGTAATGVTFVSSTELRMLNPAHGDGYVDVVVTNPSGQSATKTNGFKYQHDPAHAVQNTGPSTIASGGPLTSYSSYLLTSSDSDAYRAGYLGHIELALTPSGGVDSFNVSNFGSGIGSFIEGNACLQHIYEHNGVETVARYRISAHLTNGSTGGDIYIDYFDYYYHHRYGAIRVFTDHIHVTP